MRTPAGRTRGGQRGSALVAAMAMVAIMAIVGMATLAVVDAQTVASSRERAADSSFNLAESVVNLQVAHFAQSWPQDLPFSCAGTITGPADGTSTAAPPCVPAARVASSLTGRDLTGASWAMSAADAGDGRIRVRVTASTVGPEAGERAVEALVARRSAPAVPAGYAVIANGFSGELGLVLNQVTNIALLQAVLGDSRLIRGGRVALRCGLLNGALQPGHDPNICVTGALAITGPNGLTGLGSILGLQTITNYGYESAATPTVMASLRRQADDGGTLRTTVAHGAECLPGAIAPDAVVYIEQVGAGDGTCTLTLPAGTTTTVGAVVVDRGRVLVRGSGTGMQPGVLRGVLWAMNGQALAAGDLVTLSGAVQVRGAVLADGATGAVALRPGPNPGTPEAVQAEQMATQVTQTETMLGGLTQIQVDSLAGLIADAEAARVLALAARNASPYPQRSCPLLQAGPDHQPLITRLDGLISALDALIAAAGAFPGAGSYVADLTAQRNATVAERNKLPDPAPCSLLGLGQILAGLFDILDGVLGTVTGLLVGPTGLLAYVQNLVTTLTGTLDTLLGSLDVLLSNVLGGTASEGMIVHDPDVVAALRADGGAGIVADSFRQVPVG